MIKCISLIKFQDRRYRRSFRSAGLKSANTDLGDGTVMHCWVPKAQKPTRGNLVLLHGIGANALWQWNDFLSPLSSKFNLYIPDLVFFGESYTTRPDRTETFQAQCVMKMMEAHGVENIFVVGLSYGGFVAYSMAAQFPEAVQRVVIVASGVCLEEKDLDEGLFMVKSLEDAAAILLPQTPEKLKELLRMSFYKPPRLLPSCFVNEFIDLMCTEYRQERKELIQAVLKDRKLSNLPKLIQPTLIIWGDHDQVFPLELAYRLKRHLNENAQLEIIKKAGHAMNMENPKRLFKHMKSFLADPLPPEPKSNGNSHKQK